MIRASATLAATLALLAASPVAAAHPAPSSVVELEPETRSVHAEMLLPASELTYALTPVDPHSLAGYLPQHVSAETKAGAPWSITVGTISAKTVGGHDYWSVALDLIPPPGASLGDLVLIDDAITHEVRNHYVMIEARRASAPAGAAPELLGVLQYPNRRLAIRELTPPGRAHVTGRIDDLVLLTALLTLSGLAVSGAARKRAHAAARDREA